MTQSTALQTRVIRIAPVSGWSSLNLKELWEYRELVYFLAWRDIKVRYKQTVLGASWAILQPFLSMVVFTLIFGKLAKMPSDGIPYPIFNYCALVVWIFFTTGISSASQSLVSGGNMIKKIYFPRFALPVACVSAGLVDFAIAFLVLLGMMAYYGMTPTANVLWLPFMLLMTYSTALGVALWLTAMNVQFRDIKYTVPFLTQLWLFATPVVYPTSLIDNEFWRVVYALNPMVGVVEGFRWALLGSGEGPGPLIMASGSVALALLVSGAFYFRRMERSFADVV